MIAEALEEVKSHAGGGPAAEAAAAVASASDVIGLLPAVMKEKLLIKKLASVTSAYEAAA